MQENPFITRIRYAGLTLGAILFVAMLYQSSQMATNPIYVKGKPYLQTFSTVRLSQADTTNPSASAASADVITISTPASSKQENNVATSEKSQPVTGKSVASEATDVARSQEVPAAKGKALGLSKHFE